MMAINLRHINFDTVCRYIRENNRLMAVESLGNILGTDVLEHSKMETIVNDVLSEMRRMDKLYPDLGWTDPDVSLLLRLRLEHFIVVEVKRKK